MTTQHQSIETVRPRTERDEQRRQIDDTITADPGATEALLSRARLWLDDGRPADALRDLDQIELHHPDQRGRPDVAFVRATALLDAGVLDIARTLIRELVDAFPDDARARRLAVDVALRLNEQASAVTHLRRLIQLEPSDMSSRDRLAQMLEGHDPEGAAKVLTAGLAMKHDASQIARAARLMRAAGRDADAGRLYEQMLPEFPHAAALWRDAGSYADANGALTLAVKRIETAIELSHGRDAASFEALALASMHAGRIATAGRAWWRAARIDPSRSLAWAGLRLCAHTLGKTKLVARTDAWLAETASPREAQRLLGRLWSHILRGRAAGHAAAPGAAPSNHDPGMMSAFDALASRAAVVLARHGETAPNRADTWHHLSVCLHARGHDAEAILASRRACELNPNYAAAARHLARLTNAKPQRRSAAA